MPVRVLSASGQAETGEVSVLFVVALAVTAWLILRAYTSGRWGADTRDLVSPWSDGDGSGFADYDTDTDPPFAPSAVAVLPPVLDDAPAEVIRQVADQQHGYVRDGITDLQVFLTQQDRRTQDGDQ